MKIVKLINSNRLVKEISIIKFRSKWEIVTATERIDNTKVSGIANSISRTKFDDEEKANNTFLKRIKLNERKGWICK